MAVRVVLREDESLDDALRRFKKSVKLRYRMGWAKRRYNYFEKPSVLRRRKHILDTISRRRSGYGIGNDHSSTRRVGFTELFERP